VRLADFSPRSAEAGAGERRREGKTRYKCGCAPTGKNVCFCACAGASEGKMKSNGKEEKNILSAGIL